MFETLQHPVHEALKRARGADQSEGHVYPFPVWWIYTGNMKSRLLLRSFGQLHVVVALLYIKSTEETRATEGVERIIDTREHITIRVLGL